MFLLAFLTFFLFYAPTSNSVNPAFDGPHSHSRTLKQINETEPSSPLSPFFEPPFSVSTDELLDSVVDVAVQDRKSGSAGMPRPISYAVFCLKKKRTFVPSISFLRTSIFCFNR
eukprot:TRINITY_DN13147_c0_g1_i3.p1 TRINITY_DN13147_c0_g1~~TRINITY_DN13147_c0_g1_i3.p1  ORF type:complete len:114 (-),score=10.48 TRINITY_DN13147_c0_g1_i3:148-489(-)